MENLREFLKAQLINILQNASTTDKFLLYLEELKKWNKTYNLTSIKDEKEIIVKHFIDSLLYLCFIPQSLLKIADVGTGAGFPGLPIAVVRSDLNITLIEPSWKKVAFLKNIKRKLGLSNVEITQRRAEEVNEKFDITVSRALWRIKDFVEKCMHLLNEEGYFIISKSSKVEEEIKQLPKSFKTEIKEFTLPFFNAKRYIIKIQR